MSFFTATSYFEGYYLKGNIVVNRENESVEGNRLETLPRWISRNGICFQHEILSDTLQYSYVAGSFSDAMNTKIPSPDGAKGIVLDCSIMDLNLSLRFSPHYTLKLGVNNLTHKNYFTKRPMGYPSVGVWSSDGRSVVATFWV